MKYKIDRGYLVIIISCILTCMLAIIIDYINLKGFEKCYNNDFKYNWCSKYKNY